MTRRRPSWRVCRLLRDLDRRVAALEAAERRRDEAERRRDAELAELARELR